MKSIGIFSAFLLILTTAYAQDKPSNEGTPIFRVERAAHQSFLTQNQSQWDVHLKSFAPSANKSMISDAELNALKLLRDSHGDVKVERSQALSPVLNINFEGNKYNGFAPPDNTLAVSTHGFIISSINSSLFFAKADGGTYFSQPLGDFFIDLGLGATYYDPRVIFDVTSERFIIVALSGSKSDVSNVCIAFSETEDPGLGWNFYKLQGDILDEGVWFDYPNIAITNQDLYITGNMFTDENQFRYSSVFQVDKQKGYAGETLDFKSYTKMKDPVSGQSLFNIIPVSMGWKENRDGGMLFLTNDPRGNSNLTVLCRTTGALGSNPKFEVVNALAGKNYEVAPSVPQKGTTNTLQTGDCRIQYAVELNQVIHFVMKIKASNRGSFYYGRYDLAKNKLFTSIYNEQNMHVSYPSLAPIGDSPTDSRILIQYLRSSQDIFPEQAAVIVEGTDNSFTYSEPVLIRKGDTFINFDPDGESERWGDYSCVARRFFNDVPETWAGGCFGRTRYGTWIGQLLLEDSGYNDFFASKTVINPGDTIAVYTFGTDSLTDIQWSIEGAELLADFDSTGRVRFDSLGSYRVSLSALSPTGDTVRIEKDKFIHVVPRIIAPLAQFSADKTQIYEGDTIQLTDLSTNNPDRWKWTLTGGLPAKSEEQNPKVSYPKKGQYNIVLISKNAAGEDVEVKQKYIKVDARILAPVTAFSADKTEIIEGDSVKFTDLSANSPDRWIWVIAGQDADTFTTQNPVVVFPEAGYYDVSLTTFNAAGENTVNKEDYILVGSTSVKGPEWFNTANFYPNPVVDSRFTLTFELNSASRLKFDVHDVQGRFIKSLLNQDAKAGKNEFSFNTQMLVGGQYFLKVTETEKRRSISIPFVINQ
ncbi:MAG: T9SS type A sorting domain-containing protein [Saprospiraceae bacterium]|nr:T9SS type A sorting domain-containing protein [Saprospiraceae bacterium]